MTGDLIFLDFEKSRDEDREVSKSPPQQSLPEVNKEESRSEKIKRLAAQIESGEYEIESEKIAEKILEEFLDSPESD